MAKSFCIKIFRMMLSNFIIKYEFIGLFIV
jgi:hypothetical protein